MGRESSYNECDDSNVGERGFRSQSPNDLKWQSVVIRVRTGSSKIGKQGARSRKRKRPFRFFVIVVPIPPFAFLITLGLRQHVQAERGRRREWHRFESQTRFEDQARCSVRSGQYRPLQV